MKPRIEVAGRAFEPWFCPSDVSETVRGVFNHDGKSCVAAFPGLFEVKGTLGVVLPRAYHAVTSQLDRVHAAGVTLRLLVRYLRDRDLQDSVVKEEVESALVHTGIDAEPIARLETGLQLWDEFTRNGLLPVAARTTSPRVVGRVHWPLTIARGHALLGESGVVYTDPVQTRFAIQPEHELTRLHVATASEAGAWLGWAPPPAKPLDPDEALAVIERHARTLYQDRQKRVCAWLRAWHSSSRTEHRTRHRTALGVFARDFPLVWERMLFKVLGSKEDMALPNGRYRRHPSDKFERSTRFQPDLLLDDRWNDQPVRLVLDAKDYIEGTLPKAEAVRKQILYRLLLSNRTKSGNPSLDRIGNGFLAPALVPEGVRVTALHEIEGEANSLGALGRIVCLDVDFARVATAYARGVVDGDLRSTIVSSVMAGKVTTPRSA